MADLRTDLPPLPDRFKALPIDERGFPVPWFVDWKDDKPIFQAADPRKFKRAIRFKRCWLCGQPLGSILAFVIGPMCGVNRVSSEPPSHRDCAEFAVKACPFLTRPLAKRSTRGMEDIETKKPAGMMIERNPGVSLLWITKSYGTFRAPGGVLIRVGEPLRCEFYREGRAATREEVEASVQSGLPLLDAPARAEGPAALKQLGEQVMLFTALLDRCFAQTAGGANG
jgi:hypothetical protein